MHSKTIIIPRTIPEQLMYSTVRIVLNNALGTALGTGFFYKFNLPDGQIVELILTNKHVIEGALKLSLYLHEGTLDGTRVLPSGASFFLDLDTNYIDSCWIPHPVKEVDLGALLFSPVKNYAYHEMGKSIFLVCLHESFIMNDDQLKEHADVADEVLMVGYPGGLWDEKNNFPLFRRGITSTHPAIDFREQSMGVVDIAAFSGSSGSPVLLYKQLHRDKSDTAGATTIRMDHWGQAGRDCNF